MKKRTFSEWLALAVIVAMIPCFGILGWLFIQCTKQIFRFFLIRFLLILCLLICPAAFGVSGDIIQAVVDTNGWSMLICVSGATTNGTFNFGLTVPTGTNWNAPQLSQPTAPTVTVTAIGTGYDDSGNLIAVTRTIYGTIQVRLAVPNQTLVDWTNTASGVTNRIALSDYVFSGDTNVTVTISKNWYNDGTVTNNAVTAKTVVNNSQATYPKCIANWTWPPFQKVSTTSETLRCIAFHYSAQYNRPIRCVKFYASDQHSNGSATNFVTKAIIDSTIPDKQAFPEYVTTLNLNGLTSGDRITNYFVAYPWVGNAAATMDTSDNVNAAGSPTYCPLTVLYNTNQKYFTAVAVVDPTNGLDSTGKIYTNFTTGMAAAPYLTIDGAAKGLAQTNLAWLGHNDCVGTIYLTNGTYSWTGGSSGYGTNANAWCFISAYPGVAKASVVLNAVSGNNMIGDKDWLHGVSFTQSSGNMFQNGGSCWYDQCVVNESAAALIYSNDRWYITDCTVQQIPQGLSTYSAHNCPCALTRGNDLTGLNPAPTYNVYTAVGNYCSASSANNQSTWQPYKVGQLVPDALGLIFAYNTLYRFNANANPYLFWDIATNTLGAAIVQNVLEGCFNSATQPMEEYAGDNSASLTVNNVLLWNNVIVGQRCNRCYDEFGSTNAHWRIGWAFCNDIVSALNIKTDTFGGGPPSGVRVGNWSLIYGVGSWQNFHINLSGGGGFIQEFTGLNSYGPWTNAFQGVAEPPAGATNVFNYPNFTDFEAWWGPGAGNGGGNYRLLSSSPAQLCASTATYIPTMAKLPFDADGVPRGMMDPPGAYASGNTKKGAGFFGL